MKDFDRGRWEVFSLITSTHAGKSMYFMEDDGRIYSRWSRRCMEFEDALEEFLDMIGWDGKE